MGKRAEAGLGYLRWVLHYLETKSAKYHFSFVQEYTTLVQESQCKKHRILSMGTCKNRAHTH